MALTAVHKSTIVHNQMKRWLVVAKIAVHNIWLVAKEGDLYKNVVSRWIYVSQLYCRDYT